jgi:hypothetical protein
VSGAEQALATLRDFVERSIGGYPLPLTLQHSAQQALRLLEEERCLVCGQLAEACGAAHSDDDSRCPTCGEDGGTSCGTPNCGLLA